MLTYEIPLVPGPTSVPHSVREAYFCDFGSGDLEEECFRLAAALEEKLRQILKTRNRVVTMTGEGMLALWAALKSCLWPGDRVLAVATGPFGHGLAEVVKSLGGTRSLSASASTRRRTRRRWRTSSPPTLRGW